MEEAVYQTTKSLDKTIFRTYDIRGIVDESLTPEVIYTLGCAIGSEILSRGDKQVVIGRDGRLSGEVLLAALQQGFCDVGCEVTNIGMVPSPVLYFANFHLNIGAGVMLTGSHNPANYNGLKMIIGGQTLAEGEIDALYERAVAGNFAQELGRAQQQSVREAYLTAVTNDITLAKPLKVVIDCGNGVAGDIAPELYTRLGCEVIPLYCEVDGRFPNHHPDPTVPENLQDLIAAVKAEGAAIGLAFDGDGDRLGVVDSSGKLIWADRQLMFLAQDVLSRHPGSQIIFDVKCTDALPKAIEAYGGVPVMWKTGHSLIKRKLRESGSPLAGEMSGHIFIKERWYGVDDALYAGARVLELLARCDKPSAEVFAEFATGITTPEIKVKIPDEEKHAFMAQFAEQADFPGATVIRVDGVRVQFDAGWGLVRASNTTPCLTLRFEAPTREQLQTIMATVAAQMQKVRPGLDVTLPTIYTQTT